MILGGRCDLGSRVDLPSMHLRTLTISYDTLSITFITTSFAFALVVFSAFSPGASSESLVDKIVGCPGVPAAEPLDSLDACCGEVQVTLYWDES